MPVKFELSDGSYVTLGWGLRERRQPIVRVSFDEGGRRTLMLASPAHARGWMADILHRGGAEELAEAFRHAAWEARKLSRLIGLDGTLNEDDAPPVEDLAGHRTLVRAGSA